MERNSKRISVVLTGNEQHEMWKNFAAGKRYGNLSQMIRSAVDTLINRENEPSERAMEPIQDAIDALYKLTEVTNEKVEIMSMRLADNKEEDSEVIKAARDILPLLLKGEKTIAEIGGKLNHSREAIRGAIVLINDLGLIGTRRGKSKIEDNSGGTK